MDILVEIADMDLGEYVLIVLAIGSICIIVAICYVNNGY